MGTKTQDGKIVYVRPACKFQYGDKRIPHKWKLKGKSQSGLHFYQCERCGDWMQSRRLLSRPDGDTPPNFDR